MSWESIVVIGATILSLISAPFLYVWKGHVKRLEKLEDMMQTKQTEQDVRTLLDDKLEPVRSDLQEIKERINHLLDTIINKNQ